MRRFTRMPVAFSGACANTGRRLQPSRGYQRDSLTPCCNYYRGVRGFPLFCGYGQSPIDADREVFYKSRNHHFVRQVTLHTKSRKAPTAFSDYADWRPSEPFLDWILLTPSSVCVEMPGHVRDWPPAIAFDPLLFCCAVRAFLHNRVYTGPTHTQVYRGDTSRVVRALPETVSLRGPIAAHLDWRLCGACGDSMYCTIRGLREHGRDDRSEFVLPQTQFNRQARISQMPVRAHRSAATRVASHASPRAASFGPRHSDKYCERVPTSRTPSVHLHRGTPCRERCATAPWVVNRGVPSMLPLRPTSPRHWVAPHLAWPRWVQKDPCTR